MVEVMQKLISLLILVIIVLSLPHLLIADDGDDIGQISPTPDPDSPTGVYIPKDIHDAFLELKLIMHPEQIEIMKNGTEENMVLYHFGLGMWMRNEWGLWSGSRISKYFNSMGVYHPDDISGMILDSFWRSLNNVPLDLEVQAEYYQMYWEHHSHPENLRCPIHNSPIDFRTSKCVSEDSEPMRVLHWGRCKKGGEIWVYELRNGLYLPSDETKRVYGID